MLFMSARKNCKESFMSTMLSNRVIWFCLLLSKSESFIIENSLQDSGELIEMDIKLDDQLKQIIDNAMDPSSSRRKRDAVRYHQRKWKDAIIPYMIDESVGASGRIAVMQAMGAFHKLTCLWFTLRNEEKDYIKLVSGNGCYSKVGRHGGEQIVSIGPGCASVSIVMHELMHAIGFFHENSRYDRDQFVKVLWWNIKYGAEKNFLTYHHGTIDTFSMPYDKNSLMHYDNKAFTKNQQDTMQAKENPNENLGGRSLSNTDLKQIWLLYRCRRPQYKARNAACRDRGGKFCRTFLGYPNKCFVYKEYALRNCKRSCRFCDAAKAYS